jgi:hypothetical protein
MNRPSDDQNPGENAVHALIVPFQRETINEGTKIRDAIASHRMKSCSDCVSVLPIVLITSPQAANIVIPNRTVEPTSKPAI